MITAKQAATIAAAKKTNRIEDFMNLIDLAITKEAKKGKSEVIVIINNILISETLLIRIRLNELGYSNFAETKGSNVKIKILW